MSGPQREVWLGTKDISYGMRIAHHWAIKVGDFWYEIDGTGKRDDGPNTINKGKPGKGYKGVTSKQGAGIFLRISTTRILINFF